MLSLFRRKLVGPENPFKITDPARPDPGPGAGTCPICEERVMYDRRSDWLRDGLFCENCQSIPRERAFAWALRRFAPGWQDMVIHESSPADRSISRVMRVMGRHYIGSHYYPGVTPGTMHDGWRCENLEALTFADASIDLHVHLDVLEHVNEPGACFAEMARTLRPGGMMIFTTPVYEGKVKTERRARYNPDGTITHIAPPEYHGNPISDEGALVTYHYGADFADLILAWAPDCGVSMITLNDSELGILGKFREVFVVTKKAAGPASIRRTT